MSDSFNSIFLEKKKNSTADDSLITVFGGYGPNGQPLNDVYILDPTTLTWTQANVTGVPPDPRYFHSANIVGQQMVVVGGAGANNAAFGDIHVLSKAGAGNGNSYQWTNS